MKNLIGTLVEAGSFEILVRAIKQAGLSEVVSSKGPFTLFAPTDDAFHKLPEGIMEELMEEKNQLKDILTYHISAGRITADELSAMSEVDTLEGEPITITTEDGALMIDNSKIIKKDIECDNGIVHAIDMVLMP